MERGVATNSGAPLIFIKNGKENGILLTDIIYVVSTVLHLALTVIDIAMFLRMIFSWFPMEPNNFTELLYTITEPLIYPFRALFARFNLFQNTPLDVPYFAAYIMITLMLMLLSFV